MLELIQGIAGVAIYGLGLRMAWRGFGAENTDQATLGILLITASGLYLGGLLSA